MSQQTEKRWCDMSKREKLDLLGESLKPDERGPVMARVEKHFRGKPFPEDPMDVMNVVLREAWRHEHGEVESWDRAARAAGVFIR